MGPNTATLVITITNPAPFLYNGQTASGRVGVAFSYQVQATDNPTSYTAAPLPAGLTLDAAKGIISGTPTTAGTYAVNITATNAYGTSPAGVLSIYVAVANPPPPVVTLPPGATSLSASGQVAVPFSPFTSRLLHQTHASVQP